MPFAEATIITHHPSFPFSSLHAQMIQMQPLLTIQFRPCNQLYFVVSDLAATSAASCHRCDRHAKFSRNRCHGWKGSSLRGLQICPLHCTTWSAPSPHRLLVRAIQTVLDSQIILLLITHIGIHPIRMPLWWISKSRYKIRLRCHTGSTNISKPPHLTIPCFHPWLLR